MSAWITLDLNKLDHTECFDVVHPDSYWQILLDSKIIRRSHRVIKTNKRYTYVLLPSTVFYNIVDECDARPNVQYLEFKKNSCINITMKTYLFRELKPIQALPYNVELKTIEKEWVLVN